MSLFQFIKHLLKVTYRCNIRWNISDLVRRDIDIYCPLKTTVRCHFYAFHLIYAELTDDHFG